ncbi:MAG: hypothetical protein MI919_38425, partial [Holophagales bacterium]|nr:hypothetical protein [Holophagales bacterium]
RLLAVESRWLDSLPDALGRAADEDLAASRDEELPRNPHPRSARSVLERLDLWRRRLVPPPSGDSADAPSEEDTLRGLGTLHGRYMSFREDQIAAEDNRAFWPLWAAAIAVAGGPGLLELLTTIPAPDPNDSHHILVWAHGLFEQALGPVPVSLGLGLGALAAGLLLAQPRLARGAERGRRFFADVDRGRIADRLRRELARGGGLRSPVEARLAAAAADREAGVRGRLVREIDRLRRRLRQRRREIGWLREQLAELLRVHGLGPKGRRGDAETLRQGSGVRRAAETVGDVRRLLSSNPPGPERFRSMQSSERPLAGWRQADAGSFLRPLDFLDGLSRRFHDIDAHASDPR